MISRLLPWFLLPFILLLPRALFSQMQLEGELGGRIRTANGDPLPRPIMVDLRLHGAIINSVYADGDGRFSFGNLDAGTYHVLVNDEAYYPVDEVVNLRPESPYGVVQIVLRPREDRRKDDLIGARALGGNPYLVDPADYNKRFPSKAIKEYERGVGEERKGKRDEAIVHYLDALKIAPDYYPAHNNLGSLYLGKSDFKGAEEHFREAVRLDQNDAQAYFNLSNVLMLTEHLPEAQTTLATGLQRRPDSAFGNFLQGCLYVRTGKLAEAESSLQNALRLDAKMQQAYLQLVNVYLRQSRREDAIAQLQAFLKGFPTAPAAPKAQEMLTKLQKQEGAAKR
jgi:Tfp pilus assembly protein PilF